MRITSGKWIFSNQRQIQAAVDDRDNRINELRDRLTTVAAYANNARKLHIPYVSGTMDVSCSDHETMADDMAEQIKRNTWCSECQTRWPCNKIQELRDLRSFAADAMDEQEEDDFKTRIRSMQPREKKQQLEIHV